MENKKSKKKLFMILGGSALAFILTIVVSVAVTLAYFGGQDTGNKTVTMDAAVTVEIPEVMSVAVTGALPGQKVDVSGTATVDAGTSGAFVAIKVTITDTNHVLGDATPELTLPESSPWVKVGNYYYYASGTGDNATVTKVANDGTAVLAGTVIVPTTANNDAATKAFSITYNVIAVQGAAFDANGDPIATPTIAQVKAMFDQFDDTIVA